MLLSKICCNFAHNYLFNSTTNGNNSMNINTSELLRSSVSWDGVALPNYPLGKPELVVNRLIFPVGAKTGWHHHNVINYGIVEQGELTIVCEDGNERTFLEGEAIVEVVGTIHRGENRGNKQVILNMFYVSEPGQTITVQHPEFHKPTPEKQHQEQPLTTYEQRMQHQLECLPPAANKTEWRVRKLILSLGRNVLTRKQIMAIMGLKEKSRKSFEDNYFKPALANYYIELAYPGTPNKPVQAYRLTPLGLDLLKSLTQENNPKETE